MCGINGITRANQFDRIEKMMNGSRQEKDQIQNMLNYLMPREVVDMVRYKLKIKEPMGKIKIR